MTAVPMWPTRFDTTTPAEVAEVARRLPGAVFSRVRFAGHDLTTGAPADECVRATLRTFLANPRAFHGAPRCDRTNCGRPDGEVTARLDVTGGTGSHPVRLSWKAFHATDDTTVSGTFANRSFTGTIPRF
ncbi:hypothetical protein ACIBCT_19810 [Streptosporangium sp. NPDC050855]|uniref:hypothetical protein n=1 Tax=Streptosporangium sp. NPDC050855 TaxID=3366194 RepID=UPI0037BB4E43